MGIFGKSKEVKNAEYDSQRAIESADLKARTVEFPDVELKCEIWWDGGYYEKGSRNNDPQMEMSIASVLKKSKNTSKDNMGRRTQEIGYLVPSLPSDVYVKVFGMVVNKLKPKSASAILKVINGPTPVKVWLGQCYEDEDRRLPERFGTSIDLGIKATRKQTAPKTVARKKTVPLVKEATEDTPLIVDQEIVGVSFYEKTYQPIVSGSSDGSVSLKVVLKRNPQNKFDSNSVEVRINDNIAGHIARTENVKYHSILETYEKDNKPYECDALVRWETVNSTKRIRLTVKAHPDSPLT
jgi:hypothetical protein